jgi:hypothetical protein
MQQIIMRNDVESVRGTEARTGEHFSSHVMAYGFVPLGELKNYIRVQCVREEIERISDIVARWNLVQGMVEEIVRRESEAKVADSCTPMPLGKGFEDRLKEISQDVCFQKTFGLPITFELVKIDTLVAAQRTVNLDFVEKMLARFPTKFTMAELIEICLSPTSKIGAIQHLEVNPNTHTFSSPANDLRFLGCFVKELREEDLQHATLGGVPAATVIAFVGYGLPVMNVFKIGGRLILNNGFHRAYALRSRGVAELPVVVQHVSNPVLEVPPQIASLPKEYLLRAARPVLMKDFFEPSLSLVLKTKNRHKVVTLGIAANQYEVPL